MFIFILSLKEGETRTVSLFLEGEVYIHSRGEYYSE